MFLSLSGQTNTSVAVANYSSIYHFDFEDINGDAYQGIIGKDGHGGSSTLVEAGGDPVKYRMDKGGEIGIKTIVRGSSMTVQLKATTDFQFKDFSTASYADYNFRLIKDPNGSADTIWEGVIDPSVYVEPWMDVPYIIEVEFTDGLSRLKEVDWDDSGTLYEGQKHMLEVLRLALNKIPFTLNIRESVNLYDDSMTTTNSTLTEAYVSAKTYRSIRRQNAKTESQQASQEPWNSRKVLEEVARPFFVHIFQADHKWWVVRLPEQAGGSDLVYKEFLPAVGSESGTSVDSSGFFNHRIDLNNTTDKLLLGGDMTHLIPIERVKLIYNTQNLVRGSNELLRNALFNDLKDDQVNVEPLFWDSGSGIDTTSYKAVVQLFEAGNIYNALRFQKSDITSQTAIDTDKFFETTNADIPTDTSDTLQFTMNFQINLETDLVFGDTAPEMFIYNQMLVKIEIFLQLGSYYLTGDPDAGYNWSAGIGRAEMWFDKSQIHDDRLRGFFQHQLETPVLPETNVVDLTFRVYAPYSNIPDYNNNDADNTIELSDTFIDYLSIKYLPGGSEPVETINYNASQNDDAEELEVEVFHGDGPSAISEGSYRLSDDSITDRWDRLGESDAQEICELYAEQIMDFRSVSRREIRADIRTANIYKPYHRFRVVVGATTLFMIAGETDWNVKMNEWKMSFIEMLSATLATTITKVNTLTPIIRIPPGSTDPPASPSPSPGDPVPSPVLSPTTPSAVADMNISEMNNYPE